MCDSPFVYVEAEVAVENTQIVGLQGSYTLPGYTYKWDPESCGTWKYACGTKCGTWKNSGKCETDYCSANYCKWLDPVSIELWPNLTFTAGCSLTFVFESAVGVEMTVEEPEEPFEATSITLQSGTCSLDINGTTISIGLTSNPITFEQDNGEFSVNIVFGEFSSSTDIDGITYSLDVTTSLLCCLDPVPPSGWVNLLLNCTLSANDPTIDFKTSTSFEISAPIISVEDA